MPRPPIASDGSFDEELYNLQYGGLREKQECIDAELVVRTKDNLCKILKTVVHHEAAFAHFAERQQMLMNKVAERLDISFPAVHCKSEDEQGCYRLFDELSSAGDGPGADHLFSGVLQSQDGYRGENESTKPESPIGVLRRPSRKKSWKSDESGKNEEDALKAMHQDHCDHANSGTCIVRFVKTAYFDMCMGLVVCVHMFIMFAQLQWKSYEIQRYFDEPRHIDDPVAFQIIEKVFNGTYLLELILRLLVFKCFYFRQSPIINVLDSLIIVLCCLSSFIFEPLDIDMGGGMLALARIIRVLRIFRILRSFRLFRNLVAFTELRIIIHSLLTAFSRTLLWASVIIGLTICACSLLITTLVMPFVEDGQRTLSERTWLYDRYGSAAKASFTMFEATFTGSWSKDVKPLIFDFSPWFSVFFVIYIVGVNFAMVKVIGAIFLKQTMDQANLEEERRVMHQMKEKERVTDALREIYKMGDEDGDGQIGVKEFHAMMEMPQVLDILEKLEITEDEMFAIYGILSDDDGNADFEEFLASALKLKSSAQVVDVIQILHAQVLSMKRIDEIKQMIKSHPVFTKCGASQL